MMPAMMTTADKPNQRLRWPTISHFRLRKNIPVPLRPVPDGLGRKVVVDDDVGECARDVDCGQKREDRADQQREGETLDGTRAEFVQDERADHRGDVRVE